MPTGKAGISQHLHLARQIRATQAMGTLFWNQATSRLTIQQPIDGTLYGPPAAIEDVGVNHRRFDAFVPQQLLDGSYVVPMFK